jgi:cyanophycin synthetase
MFACAMAFSFGLDLDNIRHGLRTFDTSFSRRRAGPTSSTNIPSRSSSTTATTRPPSPPWPIWRPARHQGPPLVVAAMPGDRRDEDIVAGAKELAGHFDHYT